MQPLFGGISGSRATFTQQQQQRQSRPRHTFDQVVHALQALPLETVESEDTLKHLSVHELKERLKHSGIDSSSCLEKQELVEKLLEVGGSSGSTCSICCDDYVPGDVLRILPCKHRYHLECVDRWFLSSTDYSRPPACPMCNHELLTH